MLFQYKTVLPASELPHVAISDPSHVSITKKNKFGNDNSNKNNLQINFYTLIDRPHYQSRQCRIALLRISLSLSACPIALFQARMNVSAQKGIGFVSDIELDHGYPGLGSVLTDDGLFYVLKSFQRFYVFPKLLEKVRERIASSFLNAASKEVGVRVRKVPVFFVSAR